MNRLATIGTIGLCSALVLGCSSSTKKHEDTVNTSTTTDQPQPTKTATADTMSHSDTTPNTEVEPKRLPTPSRLQPNGHITTNEPKPTIEPQPATDPNRMKPKADRTHRVVARVTLRSMNKKKANKNKGASKTATELGEHETGRVFLVQKGRIVTIHGTFHKLRPGKRGIHIRATGDCKKRYAPHFNPTKSRHGPVSSSKRHVGDFGNVMVQKDGTATFKLVTDSLTVKPGHSSVVGKALVITRKRDNGKNARSAGPAIACGIIELSHNPYRASIGSGRDATSN